MKSILIVLVLITVTMCSREGENEDLRGWDVRLFKNTPVWETAKAIENGDTLRIRELLKGKPYELLNYQEKKFGQSLLQWAVYAGHLPGVRVLAELGADPNLKSNDSTNAIIQAANRYETSAYLEILIKHGGDVNSVANIDAAQHLRTPLMAAAKSLNNVKLLIEAGANANYVDTTSGRQSALQYAFYSDNIDIINYLILEVGVDYKGVFNVTLNGDSLYISDMLRKLPYPLESEEYRKKMLLVSFLNKNGIDYWKSPVPRHYYNIYDSVYLNKY
ncbi:MAG: ankyrin repeat domain-containing protein [Bacteroidia bacterium]